MLFPTAHALLIAPGTYAHAPQLNVPITAADADAVAAVLCDPQYCGYPAEQVTLLCQAQIFPMQKTLHPNNYARPGA